jgi:hypothetical protein
MWPPTISESHTEQFASYRWPQNKSNAIKEKIMLSIRACQDCKCSVLFYLFSINNFPFKYNVRVCSNGHIEVYSRDVVFSQIYINTILFVHFWGEVKINIVKFVWGSILILLNNDRSLKRAAKL